MVCFCCGFCFVNFGRIAMTLARSRALSLSLPISLSLFLPYGLQTGRKVREISRWLSVKQTASVLVARVEPNQTTRTSKSKEKFILIEREKELPEYYIAHGVYSNSGKILYWC